MLSLDFPNVLHAFCILQNCFIVFSNCSVLIMILSSIIQIKSALFVSSAQRLPQKFLTIERNNTHHASQMDKGLIIRKVRHHSRWHCWHRGVNTAVKSELVWFIEARVWCTCIQCRKPKQSSEQPKTSSQKVHKNGVILMLRSVLSGRPL